MFPYIVQGQNIVIVIGTSPHTIGPKHIAYERIKEALKNQDWDIVRDLVEPKQAIINYGKGNVSIKGETFYWKGEVFHNALSARMIEMLREGFSIEPLVKFMDNLMENPSYRSVQELYGFLEKNNLPITPDGCFLSYKKVREDYKDVHSRTILNKPAYLLTDEEKASLPVTVNGVTVEVVNNVTTVSMPRNKVNDDATKTCSEGLHFCSEEYLNHFSGAKILILKINPADCVSIPVDYNNSKGRCCKYEIVGELGVSPPEAFTKPVQENANTVEPQYYDNWPEPHSNC